MCRMPETFHWKYECLLNAVFEKQAELDVSIETEKLNAKWAEN